MAKRPEVREYTCTRCGATIPLFTKHVAVAFKFVNNDNWEEFRHFCPSCAMDPSCAVLFSDVMMQNLSDVRIRGWWA